jgi:hypothetical protein
MRDEEAIKEMKKQRPRQILPLSPVPNTYVAGFVEASTAKLHPLLSDPEGLICSYLVRDSSSLLLLCFSSASLFLFSSLLRLLFFVPVEYY